MIVQDKLEFPSPIVVNFSKTNEMKMNIKYFCRVHTVWDSSQHLIHIHLTESDEGHVTTMLLSNV